MARLSTRAKRYCCIGKRGILSAGIVHFLVV